MLNLLRRKAGYRIAAGVAALFGLVTAVFGVGAIIVAEVGLSRTLSESISTANKSLLAQAGTGGAQMMRLAISERESRSGDQLAYALFSRDGRRVAGQFDAARPGLGWSDVTFRDPVEGNDPARALATDLPWGERLVVAGNRRPIETSYRAICWFFLLSVASIMLLCGSMALLLGRYLQKRLDRIVKTADAIIAGDLSRRMPTDCSGDEFDRTALSLNAMLDRIAGLVENLRQVSSDVAHDLRTPLGRMRARLEQALIEAPGEYVHRNALEIAIEQIDEVLTIFNAILRIAEIEDGARFTTGAPFDLRGLVLEVIDEIGSVFEEAGTPIQVDVVESCLVVGDRALLATALINLLENTLRHTPAATAVSVKAQCSGNVVTLEVADSGPGVAAADLTRIFRRFVRLERSRSTPGHGLGLSLVKAIAEAHGADLIARDNHPGLAVELRFPGRCCDGPAGC